jgi:hypothetical protein
MNTKVGDNFMAHNLDTEAMVEFRSPCLDSIKAIVHSTFHGDINHVISLL